MKPFGQTLLIGVLAAALLAPAAPAQNITTIAGRGIGDGRPAPSSSLDTPVGVEVAADGAVLIADSMHHRIRRVDPATNVITTLAGTLQGSAGDGGTPDTAELKEPVRVLVAPTGDVLIVEKGGQKIRRIRKDTGLVDTVPVGVGIPNFTLTGPNDVAVDAANNIYIADFDGHRVYQVTPLGATTTFAGTGVPGFSGEGGNAATAQLNFPACVVAAPGGVVYICDKGNSRIRKVQGGTISTVAGTGVAGFNGDGPGATATLNEPEDAVIVGGNLVFSDQENNRIRQLNLANNTVTTLAGSGPAAFAGENAPALASPIAAPTGVAAAADGRIFFAERDAHRIRVLAGGVINTFAGDGVSSFGGDGGAALDATFRLVEGVAQDAAGNLFISDSGNNRIRKVDAATGTVSTIAGNGKTDFGVDEVPATVVGLDGPSDVVVDAAGNVIFSDTRHQRVRSVSSDGKIHTIAGTGVAGAGGDGGAANQAQLSSPTGLALDSSGNLYIADFSNHEIRKVDTAGNIQRVAGDGTGVGGFNGDGLAATATQLNNPTDVAFDSAGNMFIADMRNHRIRKVDAASGTVSTIAGTGQDLSSDDFVPAVTATLKFPTDVAVDADGNVLIADSGSNRIRRVSADAVIDTVVGSRVPGDAGDGGPAALARLLTPLRIFLSGSGLLIVDHDNHKIRAVGDIKGGGGGGGGGGNGDPDCTKGTCSAGGGSKKTDCFLEFNTGLGSGPRITCKDGDPACDADSTPRQCTVKVALCLGVSDPRLTKCTPAAVRSVQFIRGSAALAPSLGRLQSASVGGGAKPIVSFADGATGCGASGDVVVPMKGKKKKGKVVLKTMASTGTSRSTRDPDTLTIVCTQ